MMRPFRLNAVKTIQAVAFLLRREPAHRMSYMRLLKVLYISEREVLGESGKPLTGSHAIATQRGPVLEDVLALIHGRQLAAPEWARFFRTDRYQIAMICDSGVTHLSKFVSGKLEEVATRYADCDEWEMVQETQKLPEWQRNASGDSSPEIPLIHILEAVGRASDLERIISGARQDDLAAAFFSEANTEVQALPVGGL